METSLGPVELAKARQAAGFSCSQAVFTAFAEGWGLPLETGLMIAAPFGAGLGRLGRTCGAASGALMALGLRYGHTAAGDAATKERVYRLTREFTARFTDRLGSLECRELLGYDISQPEQLQRVREQDLFHTRCPQFVAAAAEILATLIDRADERES
jgi:C_GCAxxG_C_C family probable redox protein